MFNLGDESVVIPMTLILPVAPHQELHPLNCSPLRRWKPLDLRSRDVDPRLGPPTAASGGVFSGGPVARSQTKKVLKRRLGGFEGYGHASMEMHLFISILTIA